MENTFEYRGGRELFEAITDAVLTVNREWRITYINRSGAANSNRNPEELIGQNLWETFPRLKGGPIEANYRMAMNTGEATRFVAKSAYHNIWYSICVYPTEEGILIYSVNDNERQENELQKKKLVEENQQQKNLLQAIFEADPGKEHASW